MTGAGGDKRPTVVAIEAGGTKTRVATFCDSVLVDQRSIPTSTPSETFSAIRAFVDDSGPVEAIGIGAFGPINLSQSSALFGTLSGTNKPGWEGINVLAQVRQAFDGPVALHTDVGAAAIAEGCWGVARGLADFVYVTVGTGVGGAAVLSGRIHQGINHPEMGHIPVRRHPEDEFAGVCQFHGPCLEGLASGPALAKRWGVSPKKLSADHIAWDLEAFYLAQAIAAFTYVYAPQRVVVGGGVASVAHLRDRIVERLAAELADYNTRGLDISGSYVSYPRFGQDAGLIGASALATVSLDRSEPEAALVSVRAIARDAPEPQMVR